MFQGFRKQLLTVSAVMMGLVGCAHVNSVSLTPIPAKRANQVQAQVSKTVFLAFSFDNDFIDPLVDDLKRQCPNGVVSGILTKDETISYVIVFTKKVTVTGYCNSAAKTAAAKGKPRIPSSVEDTAALVLE
jgi:hypothetical protein